MLCPDSSAIFPAFTAPHFHERTSQRLLSACLEERSWQRRFLNQTFFFRLEEVILTCKILRMETEDVETVARMVALDHNADPKKGYEEANEHTLDHLGIVP